MPVRGTRIVAAPPDRSPPHSAEAEEHVIATCLLDDGFTLDRAIAAGVTPDHFYLPANRLLFSTMADLRSAKQPVMLETLAEELKKSRKLEAVGGFPYLVQVTGKIPTTTHAGYFIETVIEKYTRRELIKKFTGLVELSYNGVALPDLLADAERAAKGLAPKRKRAPMKRLDEFKILPASDSSVLLGNRYLNRGDGIIISGSSGMGKSSMQTQMAVSWACGRDFAGIKPNGPLRSLIVQSEDSDGDIGEVWASMQHMMKLTEPELKMAKENIRIVTDRTNRGARFIASLKADIDDFKPDLVWINPLQAFIDGDVTESKDLGAFLREGLNGINDEGKFGYVIIHHTTKPATGKDKTERLWHEVMYDMAGGAELINWARGIISLRASDVEGEFKMVLAKRGRRAGVTKQVEAGAGVRYEPVTTIGLRHAMGMIPGTGTPIIYWLPCTVTEIPASEKRPGPPDKYQLSDYINLMPAKDSPGLPLKRLHQLLITNKPITQITLQEYLIKWSQTGEIELVNEPGQSTRFRRGF